VVRKGGSSSGTMGRTQDVLVELSIKNDGRGTARAPFIEVFTSPSYQVRPTNISSSSSDSLLSALAISSEQMRFIGRSDFVIHPEIDFVFAVIKRRFNDRQSIAGDLALRCRITAFNAQLRETSLHYPVGFLLREVGWSFLT